MSRPGVVSWLFLLLVACRPAPAPLSSLHGRIQRLEAIKSGLALRSENPEAAAQAFRRAGVGSELEHLRFEMWLDALDRAGASTPEWEAFLNQGPPEDFADRAMLKLARMAMADHRCDEAEAILGGVSAESLVGADVVRLSSSELAVAEAAATRLAVVAPLVLRREAPAMEKAALAALGDEDRIARSAAWRAAGHPSRAAAELRKIRVGPGLKAKWRLELARSELKRGSISAALRVVPPVSRCSADEALVRASAWRRRGWSRYPRPAASRAFGQCVVAARRAVAQTTEPKVRALELQLECGTEAGQLETAMEAWHSLAETNWNGSRRSWLGRRLGIALARSGRFREELRRLVESLEDQKRSLGFAAATAGSEMDSEALVELAAVEIPDLYGSWSLDAIGEAGPVGVELPPPVAVGSPPETVAWLIDLGEQGLASREWRRLAKVRGVLPGEALAAALFEDGRDRPDLAIQWLRRGFHDLGGLGTARVAENGVKAYLPLRWVDELKRAAAEFGLDPWLLAGLARQESIFNHRARSPAGARGVVQLMRGTARGHAVALGLGRSPDLFDPGVNFRLGARELSRLIANFGQVEPALAAYNAGESRVRSWWRRWPQRQQFTEAVPIPETYTYIRRVTFLSEAYRLVWADQWAEEVEGSKEVGEIADTVRGIR